MTLVHHPVDFEPSLVYDRTYASRRRWLVLGTTTVLNLLVVLLYVLPANLIVPNLTYAGRPALLLGLGMFCWWVLSRLDYRLVMTGPQPLRWVVLLYLLSVLFSYLAGMLRGLPSIEANAQNFFLLVTIEFLGVVLMTADGIPNWARLNNVLRIFVWCAGFMALIGLIQSTFAFNPAQYLVLPGLQWKSDLLDFAARGTGGLFRVPGTAAHYIEFSTVLAMAVPFAIHYVRFSATRNQRAAYAVLAVMIAAAVPVAISRTGVVALLAAIGVMFVTVWPWRTRYNMALVGGAVLGALFIVKPGLIGTLRAMFLAGEQDSSISARTEDYAVVAEFFAQRPWLGRGPGTLIPTIYLYLDNQWLLTLVTGGIIGVAALAGLHIACIRLSVLAMRRSTRPDDKHLCAALLSSQIVAILVGATFDSMSFTTYAFTLAMMCGLCGAVWRFTHPARVVRTSAVGGRRG
ncbi:O-antigen ligase family protein [Micromonospora sp. NPDC049366]|uniref:O-antigen ligase family protein n=1 Tax=Micromonospora sp. NPDC049366 TaxID=3364271 RepID=UPI0037B66888